MNKNLFTNQIKASSKLINCDTVIKNISIVDVFNKETYVDSIGIKDGVIVGIGDYCGEKIIDGTDKFICPGLIDAHCHIESSLVTPSEYAKTALLNGVTSVIADPHEIANVMGKSGIEFMLNSSKNIPFDIYFMLPSCVPGTDFENSGAVLNADDLKAYYDNSKILGLAEVMNFPAVLNCDSNMIDKLCDSLQNGKIIDGHGSGLNEDMVNVYRTAQISTDHECISKEEALNKIKRGMYVLIREGTSAKNLNELISAVTELNSSRFCFCTDDKHIDDIASAGSINNSIQLAAKSNPNLKIETLISMAALNPALIYNIKNTGAIAPGYKADFLILDNLKDFKINSVYKNGTLVVQNNILQNGLFIEDKISLSSDSSIHLPLLNEESFDIPLPSDKSRKLNVIKIIPNKLETKHLKLTLGELSIPTDRNLFSCSMEDDLIKIAVIERHKNTGNIGLGILNGLNIKNGAIGTTIAHDSHNMIIAGTSSRDMLIAAKELEKNQGGIVVVQNGEILGSIALEIGGLMTNRSYDEIKDELGTLYAGVKTVCPDINFNPFLTLSFLSLPVIPDLKITDKGLFDVKEFKFINLFE